MDSTPTQPFGLLVIGSGPAGVHAAAAYVKAGGPGPVCLVSTDLDEPYERPPLSKAVLAGEEPVEGFPILEDDSVWEQIDLRLGTRVEMLDTDRRRVRTSEGQELAYERLILATGSQPNALPGADPGSRVFTLVTLEPAPQAARLGGWVGARIAEWREAAGVELRAGVEVEGVERPVTVRLRDGSVIETDLVLAAVGVTQSQAFLTQSGLLIDDGHLDGRVLSGGAPPPLHRPHPSRHHRRADRGGDAQPEPRYSGRRSQDRRRRRPASQPSTRRSHSRSMVISEGRTGTRGAR